MRVDKIALGYIADRGKTVVPASLAAFGEDESNFIGRHVDKVRLPRPDAANASFLDGGSEIEPLLSELLTCDDSRFVTLTDVLQSKLAKSMTGSTNAADCVFAVVTTSLGSSNDKTQISLSTHVTVLKLDANVEAARSNIVDDKVSITLLKDLLPEPGKLQKALSWPDPRGDSDVIVVDTNSSRAQYFEQALGVAVSLRAAEGEKELRDYLRERLSDDDLPMVLTAAADLSGTGATVLRELEESFPILTSLAVAQSGRTSIDDAPIRLRKMASIPLVWNADGIDVSVPVDMADAVHIEQSADGEFWRIIVEVRTKPSLSVR